MNHFPSKKIVSAPLSDDTVTSLYAGDQVLISGYIYTARDAAHKRLCEFINRGEKIPVNLHDQILYYVGPTPPQHGKPIGSAGPTTSFRMDTYSPVLIEKAGVKGMIGKGNRNNSVIDSIKKWGCVYFHATGGAGALLSKSIKRSEVICFEELGAEAIYKLEVENFPAIVAIDSKGNNLYIKGPNRYRKSILAKQEAAFKKINN